MAVKVKENDRTRVKHINKELKKEIARSKKEYKTKIEGMFHENKSRDAWLGMKIASGQSKKKTEIKSFDFRRGYSTGRTKLGPALNNFCICLNPLLFYITDESKCQVLDYQGSWNRQ